MGNIRIYIGIMLCCGLLLTSCKDKEKEEEKETFKKAELMTQLADNWIIPNQKNLQSKVADLQMKWNDFLSSESLMDFDHVKLAWKNAYLVFQKIKMIDVGPANNIGLMLNLGTFPTDTARIQSNINQGSYDLNSGLNYASIGFPALDYLFYRSNAFNLIIASNVKSYVSACISKMKTEVDDVVSNWGSYRSTFVNGVGTSSTDPFSVLVNAFCKDFEQVKTAKIGVPIGKQSLGILRPEYIEARYSGISTELIVENMKSLKAVFMGQGIDGSNGKGFDDYLNALEKSSLSTTIQTRFDEMIARPQTWSISFENMMNSNFSTVDDYYNYIAQSVVYLKTDMSSAFGILITYQDNDGD
jgi:uncharacterized protein